jgi:hypothetical protein
MARYTKRRVSHTQVDKAGKCSRQLMYYRDGEPEKFKSIAPIQGTAVHVGCQHFVQHHDLDQAIQAALMTLWLEISEFGEDNILWDDPIRLTKGWWDDGWWDKKGGYWKRTPGWKVKDGVVQSPRPYKGDEGRMSNLAEAEALTRAMVTAWAMRFPNYRVTPLEECPECGAPNEDASSECGFCETRLVGVERSYLLPLTPFGIAPWTDPDTGEKIPWELKALLDLEPDCDEDGEGAGGVLDLKVTKKPWTKEDTDEQAELTWADVDEKFWEKRIQGLIYMTAKLEHDGALPPWFRFVNIPRTGVQVTVEQMGPVDWSNPREAPFIVHQTGYDSNAIQVIPVDYDPAAVENAMRYRVQPTIDAIVAWEAGFEPLGNTQGWWCASDSCAYFNDVCPLGAAARGGTQTVNPVETNEAASLPIQGAA